MKILSYGVELYSFGPEFLDSTNWTWDVFTVDWPPVGGTLNVTTLSQVQLMPQSAIKSCGSFFP